MQRLNNNVFKLKNISFSDNSTLIVHGYINRQKCHYWVNENPHWMWKLHMQNPEKVHVWAEIIGDNVSGPFFIDGNLNINNYVALLQNNAIQF